MKGTEESLKSEFSKAVNESLKQIAELAKQDTENRGFIVIAVDKKNPKQTECVAALGGKAASLIDVLSNLINKDNDFKQVIKMAVEKTEVDNMFDKFFETLCDVCADC